MYSCFDVIKTKTEIKTVVHVNYHRCIEAIKCNSNVETYHLSVVTKELNDCLKREYLNI